MLSNAQILRRLKKAPAFLLICDKNRRILWANRYAYGHKEEKVLGKTGDAHVHPEDRAEWLSAMRRALATGEIIGGVCRLRTSKNMLPPRISYRIMADEEGFLLVSWDISGIKEEQINHLTPIQIKILRCLSNIPIGSKRLAAACKLTYNSYFRQHLARLVELHLALHSRLGYSLP